jgi:hypothetical protein
MKARADVLTASPTLSPIVPHLSHPPRKLKPHHRVFLIPKGLFGQAKLY